MTEVATVSVSLAATFTVYIIPPILSTPFSLFLEVFLFFFFRHAKCINRRQSGHPLLLQYAGKERKTGVTTCVIRTLIIYILLILSLRATGKRQIGELEPIELVLTLLISDLAAVPMQDFGIPLLNGVIPIVTLLLLSMLLSWGSVRSIRLRRLICGSPTALILDGKVQQDAMRHNRFTLDELIEELRSQGVTDLTSVKYAVLETDGQLSVLLYPDEQPATPKQLGKPVKDDTFLPHIFINDGRVLGENLSLAGLDTAWLDKTVRAQGYHAPSEIFLLSLDGAGKILCIGKDSAK
mgnify:CR=1 FL=1